MSSKLKSRATRARSDRAAIDCRSTSHPTRQLLALLNRFKIIDDRAHVLWREDELRHVRMTGRKALRQRLGKAFDFVLVRERSQGRRVRVRASPGAADGMAARAIPRQQQLTASYGR